MSGGGSRSRTRLATDMRCGGWMEVGGGGIGRGRFRTQRRGETCSALGEEVVRAVVERGRGGGGEEMRESVQ